jgi:PAS domain S-box-containing protein
MNKKRVTRLTRRSTWIAGALSALLVFGMLIAWWSVQRADRQMRDGLLQKLRLVAQAVNLERVKALTGSRDDLQKPGYERLKEQLALVRQANEKCRFIYLLGRKADGKVFIHVDSEPADSKDYSPPGQVYTEAPEAYRRVFDTRVAAVMGPYTDRWGTWVSALVPIHDPQTAVYGLATQEEARAMVRTAVDFYRKNGRERLLKEINNPQGKFRKGDLYAFAYDRTMTVLAHPLKPELVGRNQLLKKDWAGGKYFRREIQSVALSAGFGWVNYEYENPAGRAIEPKTTYVERADDMIICAGAYKGTGSILAVMGMDIDARAWNWMLARAALPSALLTLALVAVLVTGSSLLARRSRFAPAPPPWMRHLEPALAAAAGVVLTLFVACVVHERETHDRNEAFVQLAASRTEAITETLRDLRTAGIEGLARFYENSVTVTPEEFRQFTAYLTKNTSVQAWEWIPAVPAADRSRFEEEARAAGPAGFEIWEKDAQGKRIPASGRAVYYPVFHVAPWAGNERALGYDLGSEPLRRAALEEAMRTGLPTATAPITLVQEAGSQKGMLIYRPVFDSGESKRLRGFAVAVLRLGTLLGSADPGNIGLTELFLLRKDAAPQSLAKTWAADSNPSTKLFATRPVFAFGKVFSVTACAGPEFMRLHPMWAGWLAGLTGLVLTAALSFAISVIFRRREELERLVFERTAALRNSEEHLSATLRSIGDGVIATDAAGRVTDLNSVAEHLTGWTIAEAMGRPVEEVFRIIHAKTRAAVENPVERTLREGVGAELADHTALSAADGNERQIADSCAPIRGADGCVLGAVLVFRDVTESRQVENALRESEERYRELVENANSILIRMDKEGNVTFFNEFAQRFFGYGEGEIVGRNVVGSIVPETDSSGRDLSAMIRDITLHPERYTANENENMLRDGSRVWISWTNKPLFDSKGNVREILCVGNDATMRKQAEERISAALAEKVVLLKEVHHRVKNNLQVICSLLDLQSDYIFDEQSRSSFRESQDRIRSMALVHERLYESQDFASIDFAEYIGDLSTRLFSSYQADPGRITLKIDVGGISMGIDKAIPCGLIINELVSNALKHAFPDNLSGEISICFSVDDDDWITLTVVDTGVGIPPALDFKNTGTLGLQLVNMLTHQLNGQISMEGMTGTAFTLRFLRSRPT